MPLRRCHPMRLQVFPSTSTMTDIIAPTARGALQYNTPVSCWCRLAATSFQPSAEAEQAVF